MNAKRCLKIAISALGFLAATIPAHASLLDDPLMAAPTQLQSGATLPDASPINCGGAMDFHQPLTLTNAVNTTLCNNPQIRASWAQIKEQTGAVGEARAAYLPTINGSASRLRNTMSYPSSSFEQGYTSIGQQYYASLTWRLFDFGGRAANREEANQMLLAAIAGHDAELQKTMATVIQAYFDLITAQATVSARTHIYELAAQTFSVAQRREQKGATSQDDTLQAATSLAKAQLNAMNARGDEQKSQALLKQAMGIEQSTEITLPPQPERVIISDIHDLDRWLSQAEAAHPAIQQARDKLQADRAKITVVRSEGLPTLDLTAHMSKNGYPNQGLSTLSQSSRDIGLTISIPLFEGFSREYKIMEARAQAEQSQAQLEDTSEQIMTGVVSAWADAKTSLGVLVASEHLLTSAEESAASAQRRYNKHVVGMLEVLSAQSALADAQQQRIQAISQWQSARLRLLANTGILSQLPESEIP